MCSILIVDHDERVRTDLASYLRSRGHRVDAVSDPGATLGAFSHQAFDVILANSETPSMKGAALLRDLLRHHPKAAVALTTAHPTVAEAVDVMRAGAFGYLGKPLSPTEVEGSVEGVARQRPSAPLDGGSFRPDAPAHDALRGSWESASPRMAQVIATARQVATSDVPVLLVGESGTGKKTLAAAIHNWSPRRANPFVTVWCDALREHPFETGLPEHLHGALTGMRRCPDGEAETLGGGTLFFDEIGTGHLPAALQVKLLGELEAARAVSAGGIHPHELDARIIAASHHDLEADVRAGRLREDLFFHLSVVVIALPPLRERPEDLPALRDQFLARLAARHRRGAVRLTPEAERVLARYQWPGNLRELMNVLERAVVLSNGDRIGADELAPSLASAAPANPPPSLSLLETEQRQIRLALQESGTLAEAAARLGIDPATLWRKRKRYGLASPLTTHRRMTLKHT